MTDFNRYQIEARKTAVYPERLKGIYPVLGLCGEAGEVAEKVKKIFRDNDGVVTPEIRQALMLELGDVLWYLANVAADYTISLNDLAEANLIKLRDRAARTVLGGSGDER